MDVLNIKIYETQQKMNRWIRCVNDADILAQSGKSQGEAIGLSNYFKGKLDAFNTFDPKTIKVQIRENEQKLNENKDLLTDIEGRGETGQSHIQAITAMNYYEGQFDALIELINTDSFTNDPR